MLWRHILIVRTALVNDPNDIFVSLQKDAKQCCDITKLDFIPFSVVVDQSDEYSGALWCKNILRQNWHLDCSHFSDLAHCLWSLDCTHSSGLLLCRRLEQWVQSIFVMSKHSWASFWGQTNVKIWPDRGFLFKEDILFFPCLLCLPSSCQLLFVFCWKLHFCNFLTMCKWGAFLWWVLSLRSFQKIFQNVDLKGFLNGCGNVPFSLLLIFLWGSLSAASFLGVAFHETFSPSRADRFHVLDWWGIVQRPLPGRWVSQFINRCRVNVLLNCLTSHLVKIYNLN